MIDITTPTLAIENSRPPSETSVCEAGRRSRSRQHTIDCFTAVAFVGDTLSVVFGLMSAFWVRFDSKWITFRVSTSVHDWTDYSLLFYLGLVFFYLTFSKLGFYTTKTLFRLRRAALAISKGMVIWTLAYLGTGLTVNLDPPISRIYTLCSFAFVFCLLLAWRGILSRILHSPFFARKFCQRLLIVGWTKDVEQLVRAIQKERIPFYEITGWVSVEKNNALRVHPRVPQLGDLDEIEAILLKHRPDAIVLAENGLDQQCIIELVNLCEKHFVDFKKIPSYFQILLSGLQLELINGIPTLGVAALPLDKQQNRILKRTVDVVGAAIGLALSSPLMLVCGARVYAESPGPIFFAQERVGRNGRRFRIYKMRTMKPGSERLDDLSQSTLRQDSRLLRIGKWIRRWNIDETPQFLNVLKGDMSLVGPRPERVFHSERLSERIPHYNARYTCTPGMTGWAQVNGFRGDTSLIERVRYDLFYLENWNILLDFQIMVQTFFCHENTY